MGCESSKSLDSIKSCNESQSAEELRSSAVNKEKTKFLVREISTSEPTIAGHLKRAQSTGKRHSWPILSWDKLKQVKFKNGETVLAFYKGNKEWYPARILAKKPSGYLVQYSDDHFIEIVPLKHLRKTDKPHDKKSKSTNDMFDGCPSHVTSTNSVFLAPSQTPSKQSSTETVKDVESKEYRLGSDVYSYCTDDGEWYPARIIGHRTVGYLVRFEEDGRTQTLPRKYVKRRPPPTKNKSISEALRDSSLAHLSERLMTFFSEYKRKEEQNSRQRLYSELQSLIPVGARVMVFNRKVCIWYSAKVAGIRSSGYLVQYDDDKYMEMVPKDCIKAMPSIYDSSPEINRDNVEEFRTALHAQAEISMDKSEEFRTTVHSQAEIIKANTQEHRTTLHSQAEISRSNTQEFRTTLHSQAANLVQEHTHTTVSQTRSAILEQAGTTVLRGRPAILEHDRAGIFTVKDIPSGEDEATHRQHKKYCPPRLPSMRSFKAGTSVMVYYEPDKRWYPAKIIAKKPFLGYMVRFEGDGFVDLVAGSCIDRIVDENSLETA